MRFRLVAGTRSGGRAAAVALLPGLLLAACGGGGSGGGISGTPPPAPAPSPTTPAQPTPTPSPAPSPTPTSPPVSSFNTTEYRRSGGPEQHSAITAWQRGATGAGQTIAIIDTGIDVDSPEFAGRILPASRDIAGTRSIDSIDDHGTNVALVAAAARNNSGILGTAFDASLLVLRGDAPGSCKGGEPGSVLDGCTFSDRDIASGVVRAVEAGARVINISLGGSGMIARSLVDAVRQASAAGVVVVVAAGNGGEGDEAGVDPAQPTPFARQLREAGGNNVIIVGSVDSTDAISSFSQRAGTQADWFLTARGEGICCVYEDGQIYVGRDTSGSFTLLFAGTSFATPQVAGAVALLAQAFPNLTGQQIVRLLLDTARDRGAAGIDPVYGAGVLDIGRAFAPQGVTVLPGTATAVHIGAQSAIGSAATGDALRRAVGLGATVLDSYGRAYDVDLANGFTGAPRQHRLHSALSDAARMRAGTLGAASLAFTIAEPAAGSDDVWVGQLRLSPDEARRSEVLAARVAMRVAPGTALAVAMREGADGLALQLRGADRPAFMIARDATGENGFPLVSDGAVALRQQFGAWGLTTSAETGRVVFDHLAHAGFGPLGEPFRRYPVRSFALGLDRGVGPFDAALKASWLQEEETILGTLLAPGFGAQGADSLFVNASGGVALSGGWRLGADWRQGWTAARDAGLIAEGSRFASNAWSVDLTKLGFAGASDTIGVRVSQPLRISGGALAFALPVSYDYATLSAGYDTRFLDLVPSGREIDAELAWRGPLWGGQAGASIFYRSEPGHYAAAAADRGIAVNWRAGF